MDAAQLKNASAGANLALFFEGTGQGVHGRRTNVSLLAARAEGAAAQKVHLELGLGTHAGFWLRGKAYGRDWRRTFADARRWFEGEWAARPAGDPPPRVFLFGFSRGALLARHFAAWLDKLGVAVAYLGLWDTVDAVPGLDVDETCPPNVAAARHAVAEHEERRFFACVPLRGERVEEELFPGCHSDVGGLYEDQHVLADLARDWIAAGAVARGLRLAPAAEASRVAGGLAALKTLRHDSRRLVSNLFGLLGRVKRSFPRGMKRHAARAVVSLGSNLEPRAQHLAAACAALAALPNTRLVKASRVIETEGVDVPDAFKDLKFLNQAAVFETELDPLEFSRRMHAVEDRLGRVRTVRNGPRTIDLDLVDFAGLVLDDPELTLPHPRAAERAFVQIPLAEIRSAASQGVS